MAGLYVLRDGSREGPFSIHHLREQLESGAMGPDEPIWDEARGEWARAADLASPGGELPFSVPPLATASAASEFRNRSYWSRHWHGDLSLGLSYWVNNLVVTSVVSAVALRAGETLQLESNAVALWVGTATAWGLILSLSVWQLVGLWRSAGKHHERGGTRFWAGAAKVIVVLGTIGSVSAAGTRGLPQVIELSKLAFGEDPIGSYEIRVLRDGTEIELTGAITFGVTNDVRTALSTSPQVRVIHLNSNGGRLGEARRLQALIERLSLITYTSTGCVSACTIPFMAGSERVIFRSARIGFHQYSFPGVTQADLDAEYAKDRETLREIGASPAFVKKAYSTPSDDMWFPTTEELLEAHIVDRIAANSEFAMSGSPQYMDREEVSRSLESIPVYAAIKRHRPADFDHVVDLMTRAYRDGRTEAEIVVELQPQVHAMVHEYLPVASDAALLGMAKLLADQLDELGENDPDACFGYLATENGQGPPVTFSEILQTAELDLLPEIIESGASNPHQIPSEEEVSADLMRVFTSLRNEHGRDVELLGDMTAPTVDRSKLCTVTAAMYREILKLPSANSATLLRFVFAAK